jgi:hypothetical protein
VVLALLKCLTFGILLGSVVEEGDFSELRERRVRLWRCHDSNPGGTVSMKHSPLPKSCSSCTNTTLLCHHGFLAPWTQRSSKIYNKNSSVSTPDQWPPSLRQQYAAGLLVHANTPQEDTQGKLSCLLKSKHVGVAEPPVSTTTLTAGIRLIWEDIIHYRHYLTNKTYSARA